MNRATIFNCLPKSVVGNGVLSGGTEAKIWVSAIERVTLSA